ncbi:DMT family transporter [Senegalia sp. (in: firmicutes)]|uniref:DMT family transporter n=4 Tax=Senegalia sp. (in: firmicutes) TaxID=1924098 RepID=UPI003F9E53E9
MDLKNKSLIQIHIAVLFFGLSGLFGKLVSLPSLVIVFGRVIFASIFLLIVLLYKKEKIKLNDKKDYFYFIILGLILAIHWVSFFLSIQLSTVAIGLLTFSTFPVFVTFIEPVFFKNKIKAKNIIIAFITFLGIVLVIPDLTFENSMTQGAIMGVIAGFTFAILSVLNKKYVNEYKSLVISFYQCSVATIVLFPFVLLVNPSFEVEDILLLSVLGIVFTGISHTLFISGLKNIKAQTASIIASLEPVYGIIATVILLNEIPTLREVMGGIVILTMATYSTLKTKDNT